MLRLGLGNKTYVECYEEFRNDITTKVSIMNKMESMVDTYLRTY